MFLTKSEISKQAKTDVNVETLQSNCNSCKLFKNCLTPMMEVSGLGEKKILIIGDTPSSSDDKNKIQFSGDSGKYLSNLLYKNRISLQKDCWKVNAVRCNNSLDKLVKPATLCSGYVKKLLYTLKPNFVLILGSAGIVSILGEDFSNREVDRWRGFVWSDNLYDTKMFCTYHPREIIKDDKNFLLKTVFEKDIDAFCLYSKSSSKQPYCDYEKRVTHLMTLKAVTDVLNSVLSSKKAIYFDYETSGLKPYKTGHFIASIAFAISPTEAFAFPFKFNNFWTEKEFEIIKSLWIKILKDKDIKKSGQNIKYEDCWSYGILETSINGWLWDTMMTSHIRDNRSSWTGLKFQVYINFGVRPYDKHLKEFLESDTEFNMVHKAPLRDLLTYNGLDCIFGIIMENNQRTFLSEKKGLINANSFFFNGSLTMSRIQQNGIRMNEKYYEDKKKNLNFNINLLKKNLTKGREARKFLEKYGRPINFASGPDLGKLFYEVLGKDPVYTDNVNAKGERNYKTDRLTLEGLNLPYVKNLIDMKKLIKARDTYLAQFAREINNGYMHPFFDLHIPATYRSSSSNPNFQNLPKRDKEIKKIVRSGIIPRKGRVISEIDFSGAEVITSAAYHRDPTFIAYLKDKSTDMHRDQALDIWKLDRCELVDPMFTREQKGLAKDIRFYAKNNWTFAEFYGDWYDSCARNLWENCIERNKLKLPSGRLLEDHCNSVGIYNIEDLIEHCKGVEYRLWNEKFPVYTKWKKDVVNFYKKHGYIETFLGFRFKGYMDRKQVANYQIQGTSFHLLVYTLMEIEKFIKKNGFDTLIIGQIHDSTIADVPVDEVEFYHRGVSAIISNLHNKFKWLPVVMEGECSITLPENEGGNFANFYEIKNSFLDGTEKFDLNKIYGKAA